MRNWKAIVRARLGSLAVDAVRESDILDELAQHVAQHHAELVLAGVPDDQALEAALAPLADRARLAVEIARADRPRPSAPAAPPASTTRGGLAADFLADARYALRLPAP